MKDIITITLAYVCMFVLFCISLNAVDENRVKIGVLEQRIIELEKR